MDIIALNALNRLKKSIINDLKNIEIYTNQVTISANSSLDINASDINKDLSQVFIELKILDPDSESNTYDKWISAETVSYYTIEKDFSKLTIYNTTDQDLTFLIKIL